MKILIKSIKNKKIIQELEVKNRGTSMIFTEGVLTIMETAVTPTRVTNVMFDIGNNFIIVTK